MPDPHPPSDLYDPGDIEMDITVFNAVVLIALCLVLNAYDAVRDRVRRLRAD